MVGTVLSDGNVVVYESTVFPGATEDICLPILEGESGLLAHKDKREHQKVFYLGYSPERINPGDKARKISDIVKVVSGSSEFAAGAVECLYKRIISAGTFKVSCIKVAEAAKIIENTQRDLNIALINECAKIFHLMSIDTKEVISAAATKWNFIPFYPGLVGGHCIGVDPYYLTYKAKQLGYDPKVILAGRDLNDTMDAYCALRISNSLNEKKGKSEPPKVLVMGISFKENCPDMRNSLATGLVVQLREYDYNIDVYDPWVELSEPLHGTVFLGNREPRRGEYDLIIIAVAHQCFIDLGIESIREYGKESCYIFDLKHVFDKTLTDDRL
jgi:UDP-N-acetyl-D-galactosamine dehydrogenase